MRLIGYMFSDREDVAPYAEDAHDGDTVRWASEQARRLHAYVIVGYPERVRGENGEADCFYNSACVVNRAGHLVHTYRKAYLFETDLTWASWSSDGFSVLDLDGIGRVGIGICMDLNHDMRADNFSDLAFAAYHKAAEVDLVLILMNWLVSPEQCDSSSDDISSNGDSSIHDHKQHPDWRNVYYWVRRLNPLLEASDNRKVDVVACNRTGVE
ncbi:carbon-nitrogen hydrolase, partial [Thamnocephalis sphaerospora]